jgi:hypothetical protein
MGNMVMGECQNRQRKSCIIQTNSKHSKGGYGNYHWAMFTHAMNFFKECVILKKMIPKRFFISLFIDLLTEDLITFCN